MSSAKPLAYPTTALDRGLRLVQIVRDEGGLRVIDAARELGVAPSSAHRLLQALVYREFLVQDEDHTYLPGPALAGMAAEVSWSRGLRRITATHLEALARRAANSTNLMIRVRREVRLLSSITVPGSTHDRRGAIMPAHKTAGGKAMLALLQDPALREMYVVPRDCAGLSSGEFSRLMSSLDHARRTEWAVAKGELDRSITAVGTAIRHPSGETLGAITISMPRRPEPSGTELERAARLLRRTRADIESDLGRALPAPARGQT
jgi:IclR family acetate operon transcriptional repressor